MWESFVTGHRGRSYLSSGLEGIDHPAIPLLHLWRDHGVPVLTSDLPWSTKTKDLPHHLSNNAAYKLPITHADVFVDDFILLGQGRPSKLMWMRDHLLHAVDDILDKPLPTELRNEAVSVKKLRNGDGGWATRKLILGWTLDSEQRTIELPPHRSEACVSLLRDLASSRRVRTKRWASAMGNV